VESVLDDPEELGRRIAAAQAYAGETYESFASKLGLSVPTLRAYQRGKLGDYGGSRELRRALAEKVQAASEAPHDMLGLRPPEDDLRRAVGALTTLVLEPDLGPAARQLLEAELAAARQWSTSTQPTEERGTGEASG
jgi:transcriptional regulator with XRE-family HTH domain